MHKWKIICSAAQRGGKIIEIRGFEGMVIIQKVGGGGGPQGKKGEKRHTKMTGIKGIQEMPTIRGLQGMTSIDGTQVITSTEGDALEACCNRTRHWWAPPRYWRIFHDATLADFSPILYTD
jgi:hypothetical protein